MGKPRLLRLTRGCCGRNGGSRTKRMLSPEIMPQAWELLRCCYWSFQTGEEKEKEKATLVPDSHQSCTE